MIKPLNENLQILLPKALDLGNQTVGSRRYELTLYAKTQNYYTDLRIEEIRSIPAFAPVQIWVYRADVEIGRFASHNGVTNFDVEVTQDIPATMYIYNLSVDTEVMLTIPIQGFLYNAF